MPPNQESRSGSCCRRNDGGVDVWKSNDAALLRPRLNHVMRAIDATPARRRGGVGLSPLDSVSMAAVSPRNDFMMNYRAHPTQ